MKKLFALAGLMTIATTSFAQVDLQLYYDLGSDRQCVTSTLEMFKSDKWGSTFAFVDYDYATKQFRDDTGSKYRGVSSTYMEIERALNFWQDSKLAPLSIHLEYKSGVATFVPQNWLFGAEYLLHNDDFSNTLTLQLMYQTFRESDQSNFPMQFSAVWSMSSLFGVEGLNFSGFMDMWGQNAYFGNILELTETHAMFLAEPQLWYNVGALFGCENLNIGTEIELSNNFRQEGFCANPCLGFKWNF